MSTLTIDNVNLVQLEGQRKLLNNFLFVSDSCEVLTDEEEEALQGIANMLDSWSDKIYHDKYDSTLNQMGLNF
jgi:hypothetical protein